MWSITSIIPCLSAALHLLVIYTCCQIVGLKAHWAYVVLFDSCRLKINLTLPYLILSYLILSHLIRYNVVVHAAVRLEQALSDLFRKAAILNSVDTNASFQTQLRLNYERNWHKMTNHEMQICSELVRVCLTSCIRLPVALNDIGFWRPNIASWSCQ